MSRLLSKYGGKKGFIYYYLYKVLSLFKSRKFKGDWSSITRLVFVCSGNICRSPYAEKYAQTLGLNSVSYGLNVTEKKPADPMAIEAAKNRQIDLSEHISSGFSAYRYQPGDLVCLFEPSHSKRIKQLKAPLISLGHYHPQNIPYIKDPFMGKEEEFNRCYSVIDESVNQIHDLIVLSKNIQQANMILVTDAEHIAQIAVIRSLGRAGYRVIAASSVKNALGFYSYYAEKKLIHPPFEHKKELITWLNSTIQEYGVTTLIPLEQFILTIQDHYKDYAHLLPYRGTEKAVYNLFSKYYLFSCLIHLNNDKQSHINIPTCYFIEDKTACITLKNRIKNAKFPLYLKASAVDLIDNNAPRKGEVLKLNNPKDALDAIAVMQNKYQRILLQEHVAGTGVGVFFLRWHGEIIQYFMHKRLHEVPYTGGVSSYRSSWWHEQIYEDALNKVNALEYNGVVMFEYRWSEETGQFYLMEINCRFWGSLHLALLAGADFPKLLLNCIHAQKTGHPSAPKPFPLNIRCRETIPLELAYVYSICKNCSLPVRFKLKSVCEFFYLMLNPTVHSDLFFKKDNCLYFWNLVNYVPIYYRLLKKKLSKRNNLFAGDPPTDNKGKTQ